MNKDIWKVPQPPVSQNEALHIFIMSLLHNHHISGSHNSRYASRFIVTRKTLNVLGSLAIIISYYLHFYPA